MIKRIQKLPKPVRIIIFITGVLVVTFFTCAISYAVLYATSNSEPRAEAYALDDDVTVREFAALPDADAYPVALALAEDGTFYTGSYVSGALWAISSDGEINEIPGSRDNIGAVGGLDIFDGQLYILDVELPLRSGMATIWQTDGTTSPEKLTEIDVDILSSANDIALDDEGNIYISDLGTDTIWQMNDSLTPVSWWTIPETATDATLTGLAFDAQQNRLLVIDSISGEIYAISLEDAAHEILYTPEDPDTFALLEGITVSEEGRIFVAASALNQVVERCLMVNSSTWQKILETARMSNRKCL